MLERASCRPFWWPTITHDIHNYVKHCFTCNQPKSTTPTQQKYDLVIVDWRVPIVEHLTHEKINYQQIYEKDTYFMEVTKLQRESTHRESKYML